MVRRGPLIAAIAVAVLALMTSPARAVPCADVAPYPGDGAPRSAIAQWMAYGASVAAIPRELPVMAALVESGLANLHQADVDSVGYFQMRVGIWNRGEYAGYPDSPPLQLKWFVDQAAAVRKQRLAAGAPEPSTDVAHWGDWIADAVLAPESFRGRYQLRIDEARALVGEPCTPPAAGAPPLPPPWPGAPSSPSSPPAVDTTPPALRLVWASRQRALRAGAIVVTARSPFEPCTVTASATIVLPRPSRVLRIALRPRVLTAGSTRRLRLVLGAGTRARIRAALRSRPSVSARVRIAAADAAGNRSARTLTVRVAG
jgi:hypothetical protein